MGPRDTWDKMADFLRGLHPLAASARAVLVATAHWEEAAFTVGAHPNPPLIYDYSGFPEHTYRIEYPAPGAPDVAERARALLCDAGLPSRVDPARGLDHGVFIPFKLILPDADVPVVPLSLRGDLDPAAHLAAGRALQPLRREGVLVVGSGMSWHNLRLMGSAFIPGSDRFDSWLTRAVCGDPDERRRELAHWMLAPGAAEAHPRAEHLMPLLVAAGAAGGDRGRRAFTDRVMGAAVSAFAFGE